MSTCRFLLQTQNDSSTADLRHLGVSVNGCSMGNGWPNPTFADYAEWLAITEAQINSRIVSQTAAWNPHTAGYLMFDAEIPYSAAEFGAYQTANSTADFNLLVDAFTLRLTRLRAAYPHARLGIYAVTHSYPWSGVVDLRENQMAEQMSGIAAASARGLLDDVDDIYVNIYPNHGPDDFADYITRGEAEATLALDNAFNVVRSDSSHPNVIALTTHTVNNGGSANNGDLVTMEYAAAQHALMQTYDLHAIAYWAADSTTIVPWLEQLQPRPASCTPRTGMICV